MQHILGIEAGGHTLYDRAVADPAIRHVVLIRLVVKDIDASALEALESLNEWLHAAVVTFHLSEVKGPVMDKLRRTSFLEALSGRVFPSQHEAMVALDPDVTRTAERGVTLTPAGDSRARRDSVRRGAGAALWRPEPPSVG